LSEPTADQVQATVLRYYQAITVLMLIAIGFLIVYTLELGPLTGPGVEQSFGLAVCLMFLCAALIVHIIDRTYRVWPEGRRVRPPLPSAVTDASVALAVKVLVLVVVAGAIAYIVATQIL
jgi:hypothetical protein